MTHALPADAPDCIDLDTLLANATGELGRLAGLAGALDETLGDWLLTHSGGTRPPIDLLQNADLLRQSVECLERLFRNLTEQGITSSCVPSAALIEGVFLESIRVACLSPPD